MLHGVIGKRERSLIFSFTVTIHTLCSQWSLQLISKTRGCISFLIQAFLSFVADENQIRKRPAREMNLPPMCWRPWFLWPFKKELERYFSGVTVWRLTRESSQETKLTLKSELNQKRSCPSHAVHIIILRTLCWQLCAPNSFMNIEIIISKMWWITHLVRGYW